MPKGIYVRTEYHRQKIREADNIGRFRKGNTKGFQKGNQFGKMNIGRKYPSGENAFHWKGGKTKNNGYIHILQKEHPFCDHHGYVRQSRLIAEKILGRFLEPTEEIHHINGIKDDDRPENLFIFETKSAHTTFHLLLKNNPFFENWIESNLVIT